MTADVRRAWQGFWQVMLIWWLATVFDPWNEYMHRRGSAKMISRDFDPYLERRYLLALPVLWDLWPEKYFLHTFWRDDPDPLHDHPWPWGRIIVSGSYREWHHDGTYTDCGPGHIIWKKSARELHRVELLTERVTTIFWHFRRVRVWGFQHESGWEPTPHQGQDGRGMTGWIFPRKIGKPPEEFAFGKSLISQAGKSDES